MTVQRDPAFEIAQREAKTVTGSRSMYWTDTPPPHAGTAGAAECPGDFGCSHGAPGSLVAAFTLFGKPAILVLDSATFALVYYGAARLHPAHSRVDVD
jgi:hypothetical protein